MHRGRFFLRGRHMILTVRTLLVAVAVSGGAVVASVLAPPASADRGFCGVRVRGPDNSRAGNSGQTYVIYNMCATRELYKVYLEWPRPEYSGCESVAPYRYHFYTAKETTPDWVIEDC